MRTVDDVIVDLNMIGCDPSDYSHTCEAAAETLIAVNRRMQRFETLLKVLLAHAPKELLETKVLMGQTLSELIISNLQREWYD